MNRRNFLSKVGLVGGLFAIPLHVLHSNNQIKKATSLSMKWLFNQRYNVEHEFNTKVNTIWAAPSTWDQCVVASIVATDHVKITTLDSGASAMHFDDIFIITSLNIPEKQFAFEFSRKSVDDSRVLVFRNSPGLA